MLQLVIGARIEIQKDSHAINFLLPGCGLIGAPCHFALVVSKRDLSMKPLKSVLSFCQDVEHSHLHSRMTRAWLKMNILTFLVVLSAT